MQMRILLCSTAVSLVATVTGLSQTRLNADSAEQTTVTIYSNAGIVRQQFRPTLSKGENVLTIERLPELVAPNSLFVRPTLDGSSVKMLSLEQAATTSLDVLQSYVGRNVSIRQRTGVLDGELLIPPTSIVAGAEPCFSGAIVRTRSGELIVSPCGELVLPPPAPPIATVPRAQAVLTTPSSGAHPLELLYQCDGLQWQATYRAILTDERTLQLTGYLHILNSTHSTFRCNSLQVVAGSVNIRHSPRYRMAPGAALRMQSADMEDAVSRESLGEYHLYTVPFSATILPNATTTLELRPATALPYVQRLVAYGRNYTGYGRDEQEQQIPVTVVVEVTNSTKEPLPAGSVRMWQQDRRGALQLLGEDNIEHTPQGEKIELTIGEAFDVKASRRELDYKRMAERAAQHTVEYSIRNRKTTAERVSVVETFAGDWDITSSTIPFVKRSSRQVAFDVAVPAGEVVTFRYTVQHRW